MRLRESKVNTDIVVHILSKYTLPDFESWYISESTLIFSFHKSWHWNDMVFFTIPRCVFGLLKQNFWNCHVPSLANSKLNERGENRKKFLFWTPKPLFESWIKFDVCNFHSQKYKVACQLVLTCKSFCKKLYAIQHTNYVKWKGKFVAVLSWDTGKIPRIRLLIENIQHWKILETWNRVHGYKISKWFLNFERLSAAKADFDSNIFTGLNVAVLPVYQPCKEFIFSIICQCFLWSIAQLHSTN